MSCTFSVIIPIYNVEQYIAKCLVSILTQTYQDFEILCVDDCGTDKSMQIVENYAKHDKRIKIFRHDKNRGVSAARNTALDNVSGEYVVCVDPDDWLESNCVEVLLREFNDKKTNSIWFDAHEYVQNIQKRSAEPVLGNHCGWMTITPENICTCSDYCWVKAYKTSSIQGLRFPEGVIFEDGEFYFEYYILNPQTYVLEDRLYNYRIREKSLVRNAQKGIVEINDLYTIVRNIRQFCIKNGYYDKYKKSILKLLSMRVNTAKSICNNYQKSLGLSKKIIEDFGYPAEFEDYNGSREPVYSVIVPIYNSENYLEECIESILAQTYTNFEIVCVDDCSTDSSVSIVKKYTKNDSRVKLIQHKKHKGLGAVKNTGLKSAAGVYVMYVNAKDWICSTALKDINNIFHSDDTNSVWLKSRVWDDMNKCFINNTETNLSNISGGKILIDEQNIEKFPSYCWNKVFKKDFLTKNNIYWPENSLFEDEEVYFKSYITSPETILLDKEIYTFRQTENNTVFKYDTDAVETRNLLKTASNIYNYLKQKECFDNYQSSFYRWVYKSAMVLKENFQNNNEAFLSIKNELEKIGL